MPDDYIYETQSLIAQPVPIKVWPDGSAFASQHRVSTVGCKMQLDRFPFDSQICEITVGSNGYTQSVMDIVPRQVTPVEWLSVKNDTTPRVNYSLSILDFSDFVQNAEFIVVRVHMQAKVIFYSCCPEGWPVLTYQITFRRSSLTYISGIILPLIIITMVSHFGMLMGAASGGRTALGITAMLTTSSIYLVASSSVPKTGEWTLVGSMYLYCLFNGLAVILVGIITTSLTLIEPEDGLTETALCDVFRRFDKDGSGVLEMDEAKNALTEIGAERLEFRASGLGFSVGMLESLGVRG
jgi:hypothetical protein